MLEDSPVGRRPEQNVICDGLMSPRRSAVIRPLLLAVYSTSLRGGKLA